MNLLDFTYIFHFTRCSLCAAAQPGKQSQLISDYLEHEFHGLLELILLHRICPFSLKQGEFHLLRQQFLSCVPRSLGTIINSRLYKTSKLNSVIYIFNSKCYSTLLSAGAKFFFIAGTADFIHILGIFIPIN